MSCEEKAQLAHAYDAATAKFAEAVRQLLRNLGTSATAEFARLQRISDDERVKSDEARQALEQHMAAHGC
jgi:hypothetical protein